MKVLIATPMYGGQCTAGYTASMVNLFKLAAKCDDFEIDFMYGLNEALVTYARNMCANIFLKSDATHLLFIDSDIQFYPEHIIQMIRTQQDFVCGIYPKKKIDWDKVRLAAINGVPAHHLQSMSNEYLFEANGELVPNEEGLVEIERSGTGMMMISRTVFETVSHKIKSFNLVSPVQSNVKFEQDEQYKEFFFTSMHPETNVFLNEDFTFCNLWKETGGKIYGAPWVKLHHIGYHVFG